MIDRLFIDNFLEERRVRVRQSLLAERALADADAQDLHVALHLQVFLQAADVERRVAFLVVTAHDWAAIVLATVAEADRAVDGLLHVRGEKWNVEDTEKLVVDGLVVVLVALRAVDLRHLFDCACAAVERDRDLVDAERIEKLDFDENSIAELHQSPGGLGSRHLRLANNANSIEHLQGRVKWPQIVQEHQIRPDAVLKVRRRALEFDRKLVAEHSPSLLILQMQVMVRVLSDIEDF